MFDKDAIRELQIGAATYQAENALKAALDSKGIAALPDDFTVHDLEKHLPTRRRARGTVVTEDLSSFAAYTHQHAEAGASVFISTEGMTAISVLNLGTPDAPGHADNTAQLVSKRTAAFTALQAISGSQVKQATAAEWLEDWATHITCFNADGQISHGLAVQAVRNLTIEALRKLESTEEQLSSTTSAFESVKASSKNPLPTHIYFECEPYHGFAKRTFVLRLAVLTGDSKPMLTLRVIKMEEHVQEMAAELAQRVREAINPEMGNPAIPVLVGTYRAA